MYNRRKTQVDIVKVKQAVKDGVLKAYVKYNPLTRKAGIYLTDTENGETVLIGYMDEVTESED